MEHLKNALEQVIQEDNVISQADREFYSKITDDMTDEELIRFKHFMTPATKLVEMGITESQGNIIIGLLQLILKQGKEHE